MILEPKLRFKMKFGVLVVQKWVGSNSSLEYMWFKNSPKVGSCWEKVGFVALEGGKYWKDYVEKIHKRID